MKKLIGAYLTVVSLFVFNACDDTKCILYPNMDSYAFDNVDYSGQTMRLDMMEEITQYIKTAHANNAAALDANKLKDMYGDNVGNHFSTEDMNTSTKQLRSKTIATEQTNFDSYMDAVALASQSTAFTASEGQAGIAASNSGSLYLLNANGVELTQIIEKGIMGACFYHQATAVYMGAGKMEVDNSTIEPGIGTSMEHHFDEAFGYFGAPINFPDNTTDARFWAKYANKVNAAYSTVNAAIMNNFIRGRAAISNDDMTIRDEAIAEIRKEWEIVVAGAAIYYINNALENLTTDPGKAKHELSEAYAFIMSLKWGYSTAALTNTAVDEILADAFGSADPLQANLYNLSALDLEAAKTAICGYITDLEPYKDTL